jgi:hypothetical protein
MNGAPLLFGLQIITSVCTSSDLVGGVSSLCVWRCGPLLVLLLSGRKVQRSPLYRLLTLPACHGLVLVVLACHGFPYLP